MLRPRQALLCALKIRRRLPSLPFHLVAQERHVQRRHVDEPQVMPACLGGLAVGRCQTVAEVTAGGVRMPLDDNDSSAHCDTASTIT